MSKWNLSWLVGLIVVAVVGLSLTYSAPNQVRNLQAKHQNLKLLVDVLEEVEERYVKPLDDEKKRELVENMITGGLEKLDPHSAFIGADEYKQFQKQSRGKFGGIGIRIGIDRAGQIFVESPMVGTPAYEAGILAGDVIVKVEGQATDNMSLKKVVDTIQGDAGTKVTISVLHEGDKKPVDIEIVRAEISIDSVLGDQRMQNNLKEWNFWVDPQSKIAYVRISAFTETTVAELTKVVDMLQRQGMAGLVVDLRNNPGGLLTAAVEVSSVFLPKGSKVVSTKSRGNTPEKSFDSQPDNLNVKQGRYPIAILINRYSASASEIVAAALQDHARAVIIGERSYGKGSVQNVIPMENNTTALKLTTASYWRPSGKNIHRFPDSKDTDDWGVKPNQGYEVKLSDEERIEYLKYRRDRDIIRRVGQEKKEEAKKDEAKKDDGKNEKAKEPFRDRVLDKAVEYIRGKLNEAGKENAQNPPPPPAQRRERPENDDPAENLGALEPARGNGMIRREHEVRLAS